MQVKERHEVKQDKSIEYLTKIVRLKASMQSLLTQIQEFEEEDPIYHLETLFHSIRDSSDNLGTSQSLILQAAHILGDIDSLDLMKSSLELAIEMLKADSEAIVSEDAELRISRN